MRRLLLLSLLALTAAASAQTPRSPWAVAVRHQTEAFDEPLDAWHVSEASVERRFSGGTFIAGAARTERFGEAAVGGSAEVYKTLGSKSYGNVRVSLAPGAETAARTDVGARLYHALPGGLEAVVGARRIDFAEGGATLLSGGAQLYRPWGRAGGLVTLVPADGDVGVSLGASARLDLGPEADRASRYVELRGGRGEEIVATGVGEAEVRTSWTANVGGATRVGRRMTVGATFGRVSDDGFLSRTGAGLRLSVDL